MTVDEEDMYYNDSQAILEKLEGLRKMEDAKISALDEREWSSEIYESTVVSVKDNCLFARVMGCREIRVAASDMPKEYWTKDPNSGIPKTKRDVVKEGME